MDDARAKGIASLCQVMEAVHQPVDQGRFFSACPGMDHEAVGLVDAGQMLVFVKHLKCHLLRLQHIGRFLFVGDFIAPLKLIARLHLLPVYRDAALVYGPLHLGAAHFEFFGEKLIQASSAICPCEFMNHGCPFRLLKRRGS